jgi:hypothetical protein
MSHFKTLKELERDREQGGLYDLYTTFFIYNKRVQVYGYKVQRGESMRIDNICNKIYNNLNHQSFLLELNNIQNSLTIKEGDLLLYVREEDIALFKAPPEQGAKIRDRIINNKLSNKKKKIDESRKDYLKTRKPVDALPPNVKQNPETPIRVDDSGVVRIILDKDQSEKAKNRR